VGARFHLFAVDHLQAGAVKILDGGRPVRPLNCLKRLYISQRQRWFLKKCQDSPAQLWQRGQRDGDFGDDAERPFRANEQVQKVHIRRDGIPRRVLNARHTVTGKLALDGAAVLQAQAKTPIPRGLPAAAQH